MGVARSACRHGGLADIRRLADVAGRNPGHDRQVEILISLDTIDPPVGQLRVASAPGTAPECGEGKEFPFTGWLGLLRALYDVTGHPPACRQVARDALGVYLALLPELWRNHGLYA